MSQRITIDPVTRIEGHLRIDCEIENGVVSKAWASGTMWRGMEEIVKNRDPRDAWMIVQRICGVCTTTHALSSVRAAESALNIDVPVNAQYIRNIILAAHTTHDHIVHFYQLSALDWVDITSALQADPTKASEMHIQRNLRANDRKYHQSERIQHQKDFSQVRHYRGDDSGENRSGGDDNHIFRMFDPAERIVS